MENIGSLILCFFGAYIAVLLISVLHIIIDMYFLCREALNDESSADEVSERELPFYVLGNIFIFPLFSIVYFSGLRLVTVMDAVQLSLIWGAMAVILDIIGWLSTDDKTQSLNFKELCTKDQPWTALSHLAVFASPFIGYGLMSIMEIGV